MSSVAAGAHRKGRCFHDQNSWIQLSVACRLRPAKSGFDGAVAAIIAEGSSVRAEEEYTKSGL